MPWTSSFRVLLILLGSGIAALLLAVTAYLSLPEAPAGSFRLAGSAPIGGPFRLTDQMGRQVSEADYRDRYLLIFFGFSHCPDLCPTTLADIRLALDDLGEEAAVVQPLFVTLDPARDRPETLADYLAMFDPRIVGLTGSADEIDRLAKAYGVYYERVSAQDYDGDGDVTVEEAPDDESDYLIAHQANTYLMAPGGAYVTHFSYGTPAEEMAARIRKAIAEFGITEEGLRVHVENAWARASTGGSRPAAAYLTIVNDGMAPVWLDSVTTPNAAHAHVHRTVKDGEMVRMIAVKRLEIPADGDIVLAPGGYHIMLTELKGSLNEGGVLPLVLHFSDGATLDVSASIEAPGAKGPSTMTAGAAGE